MDSRPTDAAIVVRHDPAAVAAATATSNRLTRTALVCAAVALVVFVACSLVWGGLWWIIGAALAVLFALWILKPRSYAGTLRDAAAGPDGLAIRLDATGVGVAEAPHVPWSAVRTVMLLDERARHQEDAAHRRVSGANPATAITRLLFRRLDRAATVETGQAYMSLYLVVDDPAGTIREGIPERLRARVFQRGSTLQFIVPIWSSVREDERARVLDRLGAVLATRGEHIEVLTSQLQVVRWAAGQQAQHGDTRNVALR